MRSTAETTGLACAPCRRVLRRIGSRQQNRLSDNDFDFMTVIPRVADKARPTVPLVASWPSIPILRDSGSGRVAVGRAGRAQGVGYLINLSQ